MGVSARLVWRRSGFASARFALIAFLVQLVFNGLRVSRLAAMLLLPYFGWVTFASALTGSVWRLNPI
jgi:tryptophan-rich sensory protein